MPVPPAKDFALKRREVLVGLAVAAFLALPACNGLSLRRQSDLETAFTDLDQLLDEANHGSNTAELRDTATAIRETATELVSNHKSFEASFNSSASDRSISSDELQQLVIKYDSQRRMQRDRLLKLQDQLHDNMPPELWDEARDILNRKGQAIGSYNLSAS